MLMTEIGLAVLGGASIAAGAIFVVASRDPQRNSVTRIFYDLCMLLPTFGWQSEISVLMSGISFLVAGLALLIGLVNLLI